MSDLPNTRSWCAKIRWPGKKPVGFGTISMPLDAKDYEIEAAMRAEIEAHTPGGFEIINLMPGVLYFMPERGGR